MFLALTACSGSAANNEGATDNTLRLVATTTIVGDVVQQVAGDETTVQVLIPAGSDAHAFEPRPQDLATISEADLLFASGLGLEASLEPLLKEAETDATVIWLSEGLDTIHHSDADGHADEHAGEAGTDPHVWFDPANVVAWTEEIEATLSAADPAHAARYQENATRYIAELHALDRWIAEQVATVPAEKRQLVTDHQILGYFARRYGFQPVGTIIQGLSSAEEPSAQELATLHDQLRASGVPAIFIGTTANATLAESLAQDSGARLVRFYTESLSDASGPASSYLDFMRYNVSTIVGALGGEGD